VPSRRERRKVSSGVSGKEGASFHSAAVRCFFTFFKSLFLLCVLWVPPPPVEGNDFASVACVVSQPRLLFRTLFFLRVCVFQQKRRQRQCVLGDKRANFPSKNKKKTLFRYAVAVAPPHPVEAARRTHTPADRPADQLRRRTKLLRVVSLSLFSSLSFHAYTGRQHSRGFSPSLLPLLSTTSPATADQSLFPLSFFVGGSLPLPSPTHAGACVCRQLQQTSTTAKLLPSLPT
jgi:hypothetical protein